MEEKKLTAPANSGENLIGLDKSAYDMIRFTMLIRSDEEQRDISWFRDTPKPCSRCGGIHVELFEFYHHFN